jgi:glucokinase
MTEQQAKDHCIGFDLGGTKMMAKVFDADFKTVARCKKKTKARQGAEAGLQRIVDLVGDAITEAGITSEQLSGIGMAAPGPLDLDKGILLDLPNLGWKNAPVKKKLEEAYKCPVAVINDVDAGIYGEYCFGAGRGGRCVLGVFPGTGIGGGCVYEGKLVRGKKNSCMEIGHVTVQPGGPLCGCGKRGCLEAVASRLAISSEAAKAAYRGEAPNLYEAARTDLSDIRSGVIAEAIKKGDSVIEQIVRRAANWIGMAIADTVALISPDIVVLGGGLAEAMPDLLKEEVEKAVNEHVMASFQGTYRIEVAELGDEATAMGAAAWSRES